MTFDNFEPNIGNNLTVVSETCVWYMFFDYTGLYFFPWIGKYYSD